MKMRFLLSIFSAILTIAAASAQKADDLLVPGQINIKLLEHLTKLQIDSVRISHGLKPLLNDPILYQASSDHANYLNTKGTLSHFQDSKAKKTPQDRIEFFGATGMYAGENVAEIYILQNTFYGHDKSRTTHIVSTYRQAAYDLMIGWVNSPGHFANIITKDYLLTGVSISYDSKTNRLRAVQVFAQIDIPDAYVQVSDSAKFPFQGVPNDSILKAGKLMKKYAHKRHAWRLKTPFKKRHIAACKDCSKVAAKSEDVMGLIQDDSLYFIFDSKAQFDQVFDKRKDGLAVEIISLKSYSCSNDKYYMVPGRRNGMCIFNGVVPKPVYKKEMYKFFRESPEFKNAAIINMGWLPDSLRTDSNREAAGRIRSLPELGCVHRCQGGCPS